MKIKYREEKDISIFRFISFHRGAVVDDRCQVCDERRIGVPVADFVPVLLFRVLHVVVLVVHRRGGGGGGGEALVGDVLEGGSGGGGAAAAVGKDVDQAEAWNDLRCKTVPLKEISLPSTMRRTNMQTTERRSLKLTGLNSTPPPLPPSSASSPSPSTPPPPLLLFFPFFPFLPLPLPLRLVTGKRPMAWARRNSRRKPPSLLKKNQTRKLLLEEPVRTVRSFHLHIPECAANEFLLGAPQVVNLRGWKGVNWICSFPTPPFFASKGTYVRTTYSPRLR